MEYGAWPHVKDDLSSVRSRAATFLDSFPSENNRESTVWQSWITRWTRLGNDQFLIGDLSIKRGACQEATGAWLCALTAFEIVRRLADKDGSQREEVSARIAAGIQKIELSLAQKIERITIGGSDLGEFPAYYVAAGSREVPAPAVICISMEEESRTALLGRLLPVVLDAGLSLLVVSHDDISTRSRGHSQALLSFCLDYLSGRPDVDAARIGVYGEGLSAALATEFATSDRRLAAAVCDGGLWNLARSLASVVWITSTADQVDEGLASARRLQVITQLICPVLVVTGGRGIVSMSEAVKLQADCMAANIDLDLAMPRIIRSSGEHIENFVSSDDCIFGWLKEKLVCTTSAP
ncbi:alpha/beta hydrolase family protein [Bradyrhizobium zhanjiangense]|uniref:alpha/beta hydrolase family protein n=1 Tax=Bradyrhizobium zhanjiangense TaxID=1325107 RepID=UPI001008F6EA|nr:hypothetical protein [Bradyrhizobium zhanjiangense]